MGSDRENPDHTDDQGPLHQVTLTRGFWMGRGLVTQALWRSMLGTNPSSGRDEALPVETVTWNDCQTFIDRLNSIRLNYRYRLPTEAEWEYACKAGSPEPDRDQLLDLLHSGCQKPGGPTTAKIVNAWNIGDMIGSLWQWCADYRGTYPASPVVDPMGPSTGNRRIARGYPGNQMPSHAHSFYRWHCRPDQGYYQLGLRLVLVPDR
jgi:formylglycine-generating enzyme required for sulfatase activity